MAFTRRHLIVPVAVLGGASAALITNAVAAENGARSAPNGDPAIPLVAHLKGSEETPNPGDPDGQGLALVTLNAGTGQVCVELTTENVEPWVMAHIHQEDLGAAGPIVVDFGITAADTGPELTRCVTADPTLINSITEVPSNFYVNVHTASFPTGAVRGQLAARASEVQLISPNRVYDSRQTVEGKLAVGQTRTVDLQLPVGVRAALVTLTIDRTDAGGGFLTIYAADEPTVPPSSTINWNTAGQAIGTTTTVAVDRSGRINVTAGQGGTDFIIDVVGYVV